MKNIHLLPTEKRSRLYIYNGKLGFAKGFQYGTDTILNQHIYITSDEEIKEGFVLHLYTNRILEVGVITESNGNKSFREKNYHINGIEVLICDCKKIILTTDQDLINDGVQEIDDEFLEWFVKNPNCDFVRTLKVPYFDESSHSYVLIITKEEDICPECGSKGMTLTPKTQCYCGYSPKEEEFELVSIGEETIKLAIPMMQDKEEIKQETIEEAAERLYPTTINSFTDSGFDMSETERLIFINGAKWQQEQNKNLYSEEDMIEFADFYYQYKELIKLEKWEIIEISKKDVFKKWFEQYKRNKL